MPRIRAGRTAGAGRNLGDRDRPEVVEAPDLAFVRESSALRSLHLRYPEYSRIGPLHPGVRRNPADAGYGRPPDGPPWRRKSAGREGGSLMS